MSRRWLTLTLALALIASGCVGLGSSDEGNLAPTNASSDGPGGAKQSSDDDAERRAPGDQANGTQTGNGTAGPPAMNRTYEDAGTAGVFMYDPGQSLGVKTTFAKRSYEQGFNGTWVLGYEVQPKQGHESLEVETTATPVDPQGEIPEYDLFIYGPQGEVVASSYESGSNESATLGELEPETYLVLLYYQQGADDPITTHIEVT